jgi:hypothetical protein
MGLGVDGCVAQSDEMAAVRHQTRSIADPALRTVRI